MGSASEPLQKFLETIVHLQHNDEAVQLVTREYDSRLDVHINSLVFQLNRESDVAHIPRGFPSPPLPYVLVVLDAKDYVNTSRLEEVVFAQLGMDTDERYPLLQLAASDKVAELCGFDPGSVPPMGLSPSPRLTIVDHGLLAQSRHWMIGGGGMPDQLCRFQLDTLLGLDEVIMDDICIERKSDSVPDEELATESENRPAAPPRKTAVKPLFPVETPPLEIATEVVSKSDASNPLSPMEVSFVGRLARVRRMARRLVFCDIVPLEVNVDQPLAETPMETPKHWLCPITREDMSVQLIAGKTFCQRMGVEPGEQMLRKGLQVGNIVWIKGKTNVGNRESLRNWVTKRSLDIVVWDCTLLSPDVCALTETPKPVMARETFLKHSNSVLPIKTGDVPSQKKAHLPPGMTFLKLNDLYMKRKDVLMVNAIERVRQFHADLDGLLSKNADRCELAGVDCEWKPNFLLNARGEAQPVLVLQISLDSIGKIYLFDLQTLLRPLKDHDAARTPEEEETSQTLAKFFQSANLIKIGVQLLNDLRRLAASYPHIPGFSHVESVLELTTVTKKAMYISQVPGARKVTSSLRTMVEHFFFHGMDKTEQLSDWSRRPLSEAQLEYAALDAAVAPKLLRKVMEPIGAQLYTTPKPLLGRFLEDTAFTNAIQSWRFLFLDPRNDVAIRRLQAKPAIGRNVYMISQSWQTGNEPPAKPSVPTADGPYTDASGVFRIPAKLVKLDAHRPRVAQVIDHFLGQSMAKTKDRCVATILQAVPEVHEHIVRGARIDFPQRSGYVEFADSAILFVNMPMRPWARQARSYPNEWLLDGRILTWFLRENDWQGGTSSLAQKLQAEDGQVFLFVRLGKGQFLCCGRCNISAVEESSGDHEKWALVKLYVSLLDWKDIRQSQDFLELTNPGKYVHEDLCTPLEDDSSGSNSGRDDSEPA